MKKGKIIVVEGTDGSGKNTQVNLLRENLEKKYEKVRNISFPYYDSPSSGLIKMYLEGEFGTDAMAVSPYVASTFYAADRYAAYKTDFGEFYRQGGILIADRYVSSNMLHQASKIDNFEERKKFLDWLYDLEYHIYQIPEPDQVFFLNMPLEYSSQLLSHRAKKFDTTKDDIHESNQAYMKKSYQTACELCKECGWEEIHCVKNGAIRTIEDIQQELENKVEKLL